MSQRLLGAFRRKGLILGLWSFEAVTPLYTPLYTPLKFGVTGVTGLNAP